MNIEFEDGQNEKTINYLTGGYRHEELPRGCHVEGVIESPRLWHETRRPEIEKEFTHVEYCKDSSQSMFIKLIYNQHLKTMHSSVEGRLKLTEIFKKFGINNKHWEVERLALFIRENRRFFINSDSAENLYKKLRSFTATVNKTFEKKRDDYTGSRKDVADKVVETQLPKNVSVRLPVFHGKWDKIIQFDCELHISEKNDQFYVLVYDPYLEEKVLNLLDEIYDLELEYFRGEGLPVIEVYGSSCISVPSDD